ncbi:hypothetical protein BC567DRAFT_213923 [Phyllosticta citribraziliensis]
MPQTFATKSLTPSSSNRATAGHHVNATTTSSSQAPAATPQIHIASSSPTPSPSPATASQASSRAPSPRVAGPSTSQQHTRRPSTSPSPSPSSTSRHHRDLPPDDAERLRAANAGFARAMAGTSAVRARAKSDTGPTSGGGSPKASIWERPGSSRRSGEVDDELERRWGAWERGELASGSGSASDRVAKPKSTKAESGGTRRGGGGTVILRDQEGDGAAGRPPPQPAPGLLKRLRSKIVKDKDRVKEMAERANDPSPDHKYGPY